MIRLQKSTSTSNCGWIIVLLLAINIFGSDVLQAQSWCGQSSLNPAERTICSSKPLPSLDRQLDSTYRAALSATKPGSAVGIREDQKRWIALRNGCGYDRRCIEHAYRNRLDILTRYMASGNLSPKPAVIDKKYLGVWSLGSCPPLEKPIRGASPFIIIHQAGYQGYDYGCNLKSLLKLTSTGGKSVHHYLMACSAEGEEVTEVEAWSLKLSSQQESSGWRIASMALQIASKEGQTITLTKCPYSAQRS